MSLEVDLILDRRRLKRRLLLWRVVAVVAILIAALVVVRPGKMSGGGDYVARVSIDGLMMSDRKAVKALTEVLDDKNAKALVLAINSPGGSVTVGETLHALIERVAAKKPVVAVMGGTAASAGFMIAMPAQRIFARESTLTGSIGVLLQTGEISGLLKMLGISDETMVSGPLKNQPSFSRPMSEKGRLVLQGIVDDLYDQFVAIVAKGRAMEPARVRELADGRAYTGRQALKLGLIDAIGGEKEARAWLAAEKGVGEALDIREIKVESLKDRLFADDAEGILGSFVKTLLSQSVSLDGGWAVWQPSRLLN
jgi:protease-4